MNFLNTFGHLYRRFALLAVLLFGAFVVAQEAEKPTFKPKLPPQEVVNVDLSSAESAIERMYVESSVDNNSPEARKYGDLLTFTNDIIAPEIQDVWNTINDKSKPNSEKEVILIRYTANDKRMAEAIVAAHKAGIPTLVITDFNPYMEIEELNKPENAEKHSSDFANMTPRKNESTDEGNKGNLGHEFLKILLDGGLKIGEHIFSQPLYPSKKEFAPIMHEKGLLTRIGEKVRTFLGTANISLVSRFNRTISYIDKNIYDEYRAHVMDLVETYKAGKETNGMPVRNRKKFVYKDGSSIELAFTDGKFNPNDRMIEVLEGNTIDYSLFSHFLVTHRPVINATEAAYEKNKEAKGVIINDDRFLALNEWGLGLVFEGIDVIPPFGKTVEGFSDSLKERFEGYAYQRPAVDRETGKVIVERTEEGAPYARHIYHDKTTVFVTSGKFTYVFTGSFNLSNNVDNAENQIKFELLKGSKFAQAVIFSVEETIKVEKEFAVPMEEATVRNAIGMLFGLTDLEVPRPVAQRILAALKSSKTSEVLKELRQMVEAKTNLEKTVPLAERRERLRKISEFYSWSYKLMSDQIREKPLTTAEQFKTLLGLIIVSADTKGNDFIRGNVFRKSLDRVYSDLKDAESKHDLIEQAYKKFGFGEYTWWGGMSAMSFDWDATVLYMTTKIRFYKKGSNEFKEVTTKEFEKVYQQVGKPGSDWENYELIKKPGDPRDSFVEFRQAGTATDELNFFGDAIEVMLKAGIAQYLGPYAEQFIERLSTPGKARFTTIVTARAHSPQEFMVGLKKLVSALEKERGVKLYLPPIENFILVGAASDIPAEKANRVLKMLEGYSKIGITRWTYVDDELANVEKMRKAIEPLLKDKNYKYMKLEVIHAQSKKPEGTTAETPNGGSKVEIPAGSASCSSLFKAS